MIRGIGIDAVGPPRITRLIGEKSKFVARILTSDEMKLSRSLPFHRRVEFLGGRYAYKEIFSGTWGTGIGKVTLQDVEILKNENGQPVVTRSSHEGNVQVSIIYTNEIAFAQTTLEDWKEGKMMAIA